MPRDWRNVFVISRVRNFESLDITNSLENNQNIRYIEVITAMLLLYNFETGSSFSFPFCKQGCHNSAPTKG